jgi:hypothetical protein
MGGTWAVRMLGAMAGRRATKSANVELETVRPGAWAEWARERGPLPGVGAVGEHERCREIATKSAEAIGVSRA